MNEPIAMAKTEYISSGSASMIAADDTPPTKVARFYGNLDYALDVIANKTITFVNIAKLNDPFDPYMYFETNFDGKFDNFMDYVSKAHPEHVQTITNGVAREDFEDAIKVVADSLSDKRLRIFILSTSGITQDNHPKDNLYMWAHYANGHRGVALELSTSALATSVINHHQISSDISLDASQIWAKVEYRDTLQPLSAEEYYKFIMQEIEPSDEAKRALANHLDLIIRAKSTVWKTENEWRLMWESDTRMKSYRCPIIETAVTGVIFGLLVGEQYQVDLLSELKRNFPTARAWKAVKRQGNFALDFTPL